MRDGVTVDRQCPATSVLTSADIMKRWKIPAPDAVSILLGCNDLASKSYADYKPALDRLIGNIKAMIDSIREAVPVREDSADDSDTRRKRVRVGTQPRLLRFRRDVQTYHRAHGRAADQLSSARVRTKDLFIVSSHMTIDPVYGYKNDTRKANIHSEHQVFVNTDGIHPNHAGYRQMGDALAGAVEAVRS